MQQVSSLLCPRKTKPLLRASWALPGPLVCAHTLCSLWGLCHQRLLQFPPPLLERPGFLEGPGHGSLESMPECPSASLGPGPRGCQSQGPPLTWPRPVPSPTTHSALLRPLHPFNKHLLGAGCWLQATFQVHGRQGTVSAHAELTV